ncbi:unnamed protein product [Toxocara canis]|uniref:Uncharacterized protein n=1 Tax=Toxocara canis TaxID=6265 RepID=A0A183UPM9_TOXCA|nr:unnamed protein product [Toxocara canis]
MAGQIPPTKEDTDTSQASPIQINAFIKRRDCLRHYLKTLMRLISQMEGKHERWLELLDTLSDPRAAEAETKAYEDYVTLPDRFLYLCEQAKTITDQFNAWTSNIADILKTTQFSVSSPTALLIQVSSRTFGPAIGHLPKVQRLNYLFSIPKGPAATVAQGYSIAKSSFDLLIAFAETKLRQSSPSLHTGLQNLPNDSASQLMPTVQALERILRQLEQASENLDSPLLVFTIEQKLSQRIRRHISEYKALDPDWNVTKLCAKPQEFMTAELVYTQSNTQTHQVGGSRSTPRQPQIKTSLFLTQQKQQKPPSKPPRTSRAESH